MNECIILTLYFISKILMYVSVLDRFSQETSLAMIELHFAEELEHKTIDVVLL